LRLTAEIQSSKERRTQVDDMMNAGFSNSLVIGLGLGLLMIAAPTTIRAASAQDVQKDDPTTAADKGDAQTGQPADDDDLTIDPAEPDFTLVSLPTALRLPRFKSAFRVTHRFAEPLTGKFSDLASNFFSLDSGAQIGLEYRFGIVRNGQIGIHRTSDRTIEFFGQYGVVRQTPTRPVDLSVLVSVDGTNNFRNQYTPAVVSLVSHKFRELGAIYLEPAWVHHADIQIPSVQPSSSVAGSDTFMVGVGGRVRVRPTVTVVAEYSPRFSGFNPGVNHASFAIEKRAGGHVFQLNASDSFATTIGQIARGGPASRDWFLGFNISRKFY
jgi:hypothetical protein